MDASDSTDDDEDVRDDCVGSCFDNGIGDDNDDDDDDDDDSDNVTRQLLCVIYI